ncbi:hypothetical protein JTB14_032174 [Gonioctena quinquepunctata]|nr:hypothetical protein JTB14_032174 [Gonioctena quinquepunctata]
MYFLSKFCRICVQTDVKLTDLSTVDYDKVKLSEKLECCTKMVITRESLSTEICLQCIAKLRVSYQFLNMCKKSSKTLQGYLRALISKDEDKINPTDFVNTELSVVVSPIKDNSLYKVCDYNDNESNGGREKRRRITKEQRCSLLKRLLTPSENNEQQRDKLSYIKNIYSDGKSTENSRGGLKNIINFTRNYEFGVKLDKNSNYECTPLEKLQAFSNEFFKNDFSEFRNTVLYIIEHKDNLYDSGDSEDEYFNFETCEEEQSSKKCVVKFEEVIVEPDIKIKTEMEFEDENYDQQYFDDTFKCKQEIKEESENEYSNVNSSEESPSASFNDYISKVSSSSDSIQFLNDFVGAYPHRRTFSPGNVRCRTRDNPYINPLLKQQFLYRSFKCDKCSRYFKSPGYLKAHYSKVH